MKLNLNLSEVQELFFEVEGVKDPKTEEVLYKGLLSNKYRPFTKHKLNKLQDEVKEELTRAGGINKELHERYGEKTEKGFEIKQLVAEKDAEGNVVMEEQVVDGKTVKVPKLIPNPNLELYNKEIDKYMSQELELEIPEFTFEDLKTVEFPDGVEAEENYRIFYSKIIQDK